METTVVVFFKQVTGPLVQETNAINCYTTYMVNMNTLDRLQALYTLYMCPKWEDML